MKLVREPSIDRKMRRMAARVRWQHPQIRQRGIDQTRLNIEGAPTDFEAFSFLVLGDSGTGRHRHSSPQREVAQCAMTRDRGDRFVLHTGDVVYLVGSSEQYRANFIKPYREWLVGGENYRRLAYDRLIFKRPFLPVLGNHDYYDLPLGLGLLAGLATPLRYAARRYVDLDVGWHGSFQGDAFAKAFLDYLQAVPEGQLAAHLDAHYTSAVGGDRCLTYQPGQFTRLPHRYYTFRYGGIDFFALDSNTFNQPLPATVDTQAERDRLAAQWQVLTTHKADILRQLSLATVNPLAVDEREDLIGELEEIDEALHDLDKQLAQPQAITVDEAQLDWLRDRLIASWQDPTARGRILFFHHPPYVTEATKWFQGQTLAVRHHLRRVLDAVQAQVGAIAQGQPLVNLVLCGHAHCLDYVQTGDTGHGDAHIPWVVCGGSGYSLRRQRAEGATLTEQRGEKVYPVAESRLFLGRSGKGSTLVRPYSAVRVTVGHGQPLTLAITPLVAERAEGEWRAYELGAIALPTVTPAP